MATSAAAASSFLGTELIAASNGGKFRARFGFGRKKAVKKSPRRPPTIVPCGSRAPRLPNISTAPSSETTASTPSASASPQSTSSTTSTRSTRTWPRTTRERSSAPGSSRRRSTPPLPALHRSVRAAEVPGVRAHPRQVGHARHPRSPVGRGPYRCHMARCRKGTYVSVVNFFLI
ncbi:putative chlorophyll a-b binding protein CP29.1, chloroplastic [Iris pallida]|uniref:Chlorophyll a-b binding protein CP29.1, chloroplastic n=1 Tax=Iris pallida TaxID=29817 RepID=A0AAX6GXM5_IRIPA|nr:putative chlorophyll a-b binding protein CP29.1, chloroplastic [Iris pallida]